jgi:flagellar biosynthesis component FlhA
MLTPRFFKFLTTASFSDSLGMGAGLAVVIGIIGAIPYGPPIAVVLLIGDFLYCILSTISQSLYPILVTRPRERRQQQEAAEQTRKAAEEAARTEEATRTEAARQEAEQIAAYERLFTEDDEDAESPFEETEERRSESRAG